MRHARAVIAALAFVAATSFLGSAALAGPEWCEEDPEFVVNGAIVDVTTFFPGSYAYYVKGPVNFDLQVPSNAIAYARSLPGTIPVTASISRTLPPYYGIGRIPVVVTVTMSSTRSFQTYTQITGLGGSILTGVYGDAERPTSAKFSMYGF